MGRRCLQTFKHKRKSHQRRLTVVSLLIGVTNSGYCQQMDTHQPTTTVREALLFSAKLRQPQSVPDSEKEA